LKLENLKVIAKLLTGQVATYDGHLPLDGILAMAWMRKHHPELVGQPIDFNNMIDAELPLEKRGEGDNWYWACSFACFTPLKETKRYWHKRFDEQYAEKYIDFGKKRGTVNTKSGEYKAYRIPLNIILIPEITWYAVGDKEEVQELLTEITHIGKKSAQGLGAVREWTVNSIDEDLSWLRPMPDENGDDFIAIRPPYWYFENYRRVAWPDDARLGARAILTSFANETVQK
jgi:CRISPR type IV-associated protein Csf3